MQRTILLFLFLQSLVCRIFSSQMLQAINCITVKYCNQIEQSSNKNLHAEIVKYLLKNQF